MHKVKLEGPMEPHFRYVLSSLMCLEHRYVSLKLHSKEADGDQAPIEPTDKEGTKEVTKVTKEVKEVHALVRNITNTCLDFLPGSTMHNPVFVRLITNDSGGVYANSAHDLLA